MINFFINRNKISELENKICVISAELESYKQKCEKLEKKCANYEKELEQIRRKSETKQDTSDPIANVQGSSSNSSCNDGSHLKATRPDQVIQFDNSSVPTSQGLKRQTEGEADTQSKSNKADDVPNMSGSRASGKKPVSSNGRCLINSCPKRSQLSTSG